MIGGIFGKATEVPETWDRFSNLNISGAWNESDFDEVTASARRLGMTVENDGERIVLWRSKSCNGWFMLNKRGKELATEFLEGVS
jgi:hypothetical protein